MLAIWDPLVLEICIVTAMQMQMTIREQITVIIFIERYVCNKCLFLFHFHWKIYKNLRQICKKM